MSDIHYPQRVVLYSIVSTSILSNDDLHCSHRIVHQSNVKTYFSRLKSMIKLTFENKKKQNGQNQKLNIISHARTGVSSNSNSNSNMSWPPTVSHTIKRYFKYVLNCFYAWKLFLRNRLTRWLQSVRRLLNLFHCQVWGLLNEDCWGEDCWDCWGLLGLRIAGIARIAEDC